MGFHITPDGQKRFLCGKKALYGEPIKPKAKKGPIVHIGSPQPARVKPLPTAAKQRLCDLPPDRIAGFLANAGFHVRITRTSYVLTLTPPTAKQRAATPGQLCLF